MSKNKDLCNQTEAGVECNRTGNNLTVNLFNVMPVDAGIYICKIRAMQGAKAKPINITVEGELPSNLCWDLSASLLRLF